MVGPKPAAGGNPGGWRKEMGMRKRYSRKAAAWLVSALMISTLLVVVMPGAAQACGYQTWYLPEGYTGGNFDTYILIQNPNDWDAEAKVRFMTDSSVTDPVKYELGPNSRTTINVDEQPGLEDANVSTMVESSSGVVVERAMYFNDPADGKVGGSDSIGANQTSTTWYLAEGYTGQGFDTYVLVMNPNESKAYVKVTYITPVVVGGAGRQMNPYDGEPEVVPEPTPEPTPNYITKYYEVDPMRRYTIQVDEIPGLEDTDVSFKVESVAPPEDGAGRQMNPYDGEPEVEPEPKPEPKPECPVGIVAERAMYFTYHGFLGGHASIGAPQASNIWYLPEGRTAGEYDTFVLVMNPNTVKAHIKASFMVPADSGTGRRMNPYDNEPEVEPEPAPEDKTEPGKVITREFTLEPMERFTIPLDEIEGLEATDVSTMIESWGEESACGVGGGGCAPVVVERAMYFARGNSGDGHNSIGAYEKMEYWLLAEGYTAGGFDTWVLVQNPNAIEVTIKVTFMKPEGEPIVKEYKLAATSRLTIPVDEIEGLQSTEVSTKIQVLGAVECERSATCENGVVAERAMYFEYKGIVGGHGSLGVGE
jgi:hypothetical protein